MKLGYMGVRVDGQRAPLPAPRVYRSYLCLTQIKMAKHREIKNAKLCGEILR